VLQERLISYFEVNNIDLAENSLRSDGSVGLVKLVYYIADLEKKAQTIVKSSAEGIVGEAKHGIKEGFLNTITKSDEPLQTYYIDHGFKKELFNQIWWWFSIFVWFYPT